MSGRRPLLAILPIGAKPEPGPRSPARVAVAPSRVTRSVLAGDLASTDQYAADELTG